VASTKAESEESHLSDEELLLARKSRLPEFIRMRQQNFDMRIQPSETSRA
jgi:hypothetical protein